MLRAAQHDILGIARIATQPASGERGGGNLRELRKLAVLVVQSGSGEMKSTVDQLAQRLGAELGAAAVITEPSVLASHIVDGMQPALVCSPATPDQIAAALPGFV